jgi:tetratricopeptide (TPR) repeat protein
MISVEIQTKLRAMLNTGIIHWLERKPDEAIAYFEQVRAQFDSCNDSLLKAKFHNNYGLCFKLKAEITGDKSYLQKTLAEYQLVKSHLKEIDDLPAIAIVEANIANVLLMLGKTDEAHSYLNIAEEILTDFNDESLLGQTLETRARVFFAEGDIEQAKQAIERSEKLLMSGVEFGPLAETLKTKEMICEGSKGESA